MRHHQRDTLSKRIDEVAWMLVGCLLWCQPVAAQSDSVVAVGGGASVYWPSNASADDSVSYSFVYRLGKPRGWRPTFAFNWFTTDFRLRVGGVETSFGGLRVRPVMAGYGYTFQHGRLATSLTAVAGPSFNGFNIDDRARLAYQQQLGLTLLRVKASSTVVVRPALTMWYDASSRIGFLASVGYVVARPNVTIITGANRTTMRLRADSLKVQMGLVYGLF